MYDVVVFIVGFLYGWLGQARFTFLPKLSIFLQTNPLDIPVFVNKRPLLLRGTGGYMLKTT